MKNYLYLVAILAAAQFYGLYRLAKYYAYNFVPTVQGVNVFLQGNVVIEVAINVENLNSIGFPLTELKGRIVYKKTEIGIFRTTEPIWIEGGENTTIIMRIMPNISLISSLSFVALTHTITVSGTLKAGSLPALPFTIENSINIM